MNSGAAVGSFATSSFVGVELDGTSTLTMTGGTVENGYYGVLDTGTSTSSISGGTVIAGYYNIDLNGGGTLNITGGNFNGGCDTLSSQNGSVINIYGTGLTLTGTRITGTLQDGESINVGEAIGSGSQINLINSPAVPEPDPWLLLSGGLVLLGVGTWRRRRRA